MASVTTEGLDHSNFGDYRRDYGQLLVYCDGCFMYGDHISSTNKYQLKLKNYKSLTISRDSMKEKIDKEVKNFISGHETKERLSVMDRANSCIIIKGDELTFVQGRNGFDRKSLDFNGRKFNIRKDISVLHEVFDGIFFLNVSEFATKFDKLLAIISKHGLEDTPLVFDRSFHLFEMAVNLMDEPDFDWEAVKQNLRHYRNACDKVMRTFLVKVHRSQMADAQGDGLVLSDSIESKTFGNHPMFGSKLTNAWDSFMSEFSNKEELFCALLS